MRSCVITRVFVASSRHSWAQLRPHSPDSDPLGEGPHGDLVSDGWYGGCC